MCEYCQKNVCPSNCPNAEPPKEDASCAKCGAKLFEMDRVLRIDDRKVWCEFCVDDNMGYL